MRYRLLGPLLVEGSVDIGPPKQRAVLAVLLPEVAEAVVGHAAALVASVAPWSTGGQLPNFAPSTDPGRPTRVYREDTLHWLRALARRYDPAGVLR